MIKAIIFDMDGVIADTQMEHTKIGSEIFSRFGIDISPEELTRRYAGMPAPLIYRTVLEGIEADIDALVEEKWERMIEHARNDLQAIPGVVDLIKKLVNNDFRLAVASASRRSFVEAVLERLDIKDHFTKVVTGDDISRGKPNPDIFLFAAKQLNVKPFECLVIEDARNGMEAAKRAKMLCVGYVKNMEEEYPADILISDFNDFNIASFNKE